mmetsp:Transcript_34856/g.56229  ORF Transcript_34856/g.56229 Transcript_34856/m.56229 type:complete len:135 (+) Transcript_34856:152-556(+)
MALFVWVYGFDRLSPICIALDIVISLAIIAVTGIITIITIITIISGVILPIDIISIILDIVRFIIDICTVDITMGIIIDIIIDFTAGRLYWTVWAAAYDFSWGLEALRISRTESSPGRCLRKPLLLPRAISYGA